MENILYEIKKIIKKVFYFQKRVTFDISKATKQSNKHYQNETIYLTNDWRRLQYCRHQASFNLGWKSNLNFNNRFNH